MRHIADLQQDNFTDNGPEERLSTLDLDLPAVARRTRGGLDDDAQSKPHVPLSKRQKKTEVKRLLTTRKTLAILVQESGVESLPANVPSHLNTAAAPSTKPPRKFCSVCGYFSNYNCVRCGMLYCSIKCRDTHTETRCLKYTA
ncbi:hypothetical protein HKX48_006038 [Thoreauomyces humboldtii]|nr:hypothetical protein HKX48_006038 [Thoreauomyces humboldtii]